MNRNFNVIHGFADAKPVILHAPHADLCSAPGAALYAGVLWWRELIARLRAETGWQGEAYLDCGDDAAVAVEAIHCGVTQLMLAPDCALFNEVSALAVQAGGAVLPPLAAP